MLRYLAHGERDYRRNPNPITQRSGWELEAVIAGRIAPTEAGRQHPLRSRRLWLWPPRRAHGWSGDGRPAEVVVFGPVRIPEPLARAAERAGQAGAVLECALDDADAAWLAATADRLLADQSRPDHLTALRQEIAVAELALRIYDRCPPAWRDPSGLRPEQLVASALAWHAEHMAEAPRAEDVAAAMHVSMAHLRRLFHRACGRSPRAMLQEAALARADELLNATAMGSAAVAAACGFGSAAAFTRAYARHRGCPPGRARRGHEHPRVALPT